MPLLSNFFWAKIILILLALRLAIRTGFGSIEFLIKFRSKTTNGFHLRDGVIKDSRHKQRQRGSNHRIISWDIAAESLWRSGRKETTMLLLLLLRTSDNAARSEQEGHHFFDWFVFGGT